MGGCADDLDMQRALGSGHLEALEAPPLFRGKRPNSHSFTSSRSDDEAGKRQRRGGQRQGGPPDGRCCAACGHADTSDDPVDIVVLKSKMPRCWGYPAKNDMQQGSLCLYCMIVYQSRFKHKGLSQKAFLQGIGGNSEEHTQFLTTMEQVVRFFIEKDGRQAMLNWADIDKRVISVITEDRVEIHEPDDKLWDYTLYVTQFGDPTTNGKGHVETREFGRHEVKVPEAPIRSLKRIKAKIIQDKCVVDAGNQSFFAGQQDLLISELNQMIALPKATGQAISMAEIFGGGVGAGDSAGSGNRQAADVGGCGGGSVAAASSEDGDVGINFGFSLALSPAAKNTPRAAQSVGSEPQQQPAQVRARAKAKVAAAIAPTRTHSPQSGKCSGMAVTGGTGTGSPGVQQGDGKKAKGKPRRELGSTSEALVKEFEEATEASAQYFGQTWKNHQRYCQRLQMDVDEKVKSTEDMTEMATLNAYSKQIGAIMSLCKFVSKHGFDCEGLADCYENQLHFLKMSPPADVRLPRFFLLKQLSARLQGATTSAAFWRLLHTDALHSAGFTSEKDQNSVSRKAIKSRVLHFVKMQQVSEMVSGLSEFFHRASRSRASSSQCGRRWRRFAWWPTSSLAS